MAGKPEIDELRKRRTQYYSASLQERRKEPAPDLLKPRVMLETRTRSRSSKAGSEKSRRSRTSKTSSRSAKRPSSRNKDEDGAYNTSATLSRHSQDRSRHSSSPRRRSLPTALELEVTPNDSISQVGATTPARHRSRKATRPTVKRSSTQAKLPPIIEADGDAQSSTTAPRPPVKRQSILGTLFGRRNTAPAIPAPPRLVECLTCGADDVPSGQSAKLECGHRMCNDCLKRIFEMSVKDPAHMPPKCCTKQSIPLKNVDKLFDVR